MVGSEGRLHLGEKCHSCVDPPNVCEQGYFCKLDCKCRGFDHLIFENFRTFARIVQCIDIEIAEVDFAGRARCLARKDGLGITKDVMEEIVLDILSGEWFGIVSLYGEGLAAQVSYERDGIVWPARAMGR